MTVQPSTTSTLMLRPVDELLDECEGLVARIKLSFGFNRTAFEHQIMPLIRAHAAYVGWLPATAADCFDRPGGLFRLGLETAFYAVQGTDAYIFSGPLTISARRRLEPRWRLATFAAGLCGELHRALGAVRVLAESGAFWPAFLIPLSAWLEKQGHPPCQLRWNLRSAETRSLGLLVLAHILPNRLIQDLAEDNDVVVPHLLASVGGLPLLGGRNVLEELVRRAFALVVERDLETHGKRDPAAGHGRHQTRYLIEGLQRLVARDSGWRPNQEKSRVWYAHDGLFLVWPGAGQDLRRLLEGDQIAGMPEAPEAMLARLLDAGLLERRLADEPTWRIRPAAATAPLVAVKFASPALLLRGLETPVVPRDEPLVADRPEPTAPTPEIGTRPPPRTGPVDTPAAPVEPTARTTSTATFWQLKAPLRLNAAVRHALAAILAAPAEDIVLLASDDALFVPLAKFETHGIDPTLAIRALSELGMLVRGAPGAPPTIKRRDASGAEVSGIGLKAHCVAPATTPTTLALSE